MNLFEFLFQDFQNDLDEVQNNLKEITIQIQNQLNEIVENSKIYFVAIANAISEYTIEAKKYYYEYNRTVFKNGWIISPFIWDHSGIAKAKLTDLQSEFYTHKIFKDFLFSKKFQNLKLMIDSWKSNELFNNRINIFIDCYELLRKYHNSKTLNIHTILIPVLIAQLDAISFELMVKLGYKPLKNKFVDSDSKFINRWKWIDNNDNFLMEKFFLYILLKDVLFQHSEPNKKVTNEILKEYGIVQMYSNFSRNKIMHGENTEYGTLKNTLITYLILDVLSGIKSNIEQDK